MSVINRSQIKMLMEREEARFVAERPKSKALFERARTSLLKGTPMAWMNIWPSPFPIFVKEAKGARLTDVDGHRYVDLCLGDTGAMFGHSPKPAVDAISRQLRRGLTYMLPTEDSIWVGEELARRFGLPYWQVYMTATDANIFAIRAAREITKRTLTLIYNGSYHGNITETLVRLKDGAVRPRSGVVGAFPNPELTTQVVEFNDVAALEKALASRDIACVLCEPAMTDMGIILPEPGYLTALRELTRRYGTLLILDETHTICAGPRGCTGAWKLEPDIFTLGKAIAGGLPAAVMGVNREVGEKLAARSAGQMILGMGGTLHGNALQIAAIRATFEQLITESAYQHTIPLAERLANGVSEIIKANGLPWHVVRLGCRVEYRYGANAPRNGAEAKAALDMELDHLIRLYLLNRGIIITPFHNMTLMSPKTTAEDVDFHNQKFTECVKELVGSSAI